MFIHLRIYVKSDYEFNTVRKFIVQKVDKEFGQFFTVFIS